MYGIYTAADSNFFAGVVGSINSLRFHRYTGAIAVIDTGLDSWMKDYLAGFPGVEVLSLEPIRRAARFTDVLCDENPVDKNWAYKAFAIVHYERFDCFTFIDGDFFPMCNIQPIVEPLVQQGAVVCTEDGTNCWTPEHHGATGVPPGRYMNVNAGFLTFNLAYHQHILWEWRNLMTRKKACDLWYGDQGAINVVMDKYHTEKRLLDKRLWNQTHLNEKMARENAVEACDGLLRLKQTGERIYAWHGTGWHKLWHCIGIDHFRNDPQERIRFFEECMGRVPAPILRQFEHDLFMGDFNQRLKREGNRLVRSHSEIMQNDIPYPSS